MSSQTNSTKHGAKLGVAIVDGNECNILYLYNKLWLIDPVTSRTAVTGRFKNLEAIRAKYTVVSK